METKDGKSSPSFAPKPTVRLSPRNITGPSLLDFLTVSWRKNKNHMPKAKTNIKIVRIKSLIILFTILDWLEFRFFWIS